MEPDSILSRLAGRPDENSLDDLQAVLNLHNALKGKSADESQLYANKILPKLWSLLEAKFSSIDKQILCSICVFTLAPHSRLCGSYLKMTLLKLYEYQKNEKDGDPYFIVSLVSGFYQSSLMNQLAADTVKVSDIEDAYLKTIIRRSLDLLHSMAYLYSQYTFAVFRALVNAKKLLQTKYKTILIEEYGIKLLSASVHNWENPMNGVRDMNKSLFSLCFEITKCTNQIRGSLLSEINEFPWNKAKYLMIAEIMKNFTGNIHTLLRHYPNWVEWCVRSLSVPNLVSAGTDLYFALLKNVKNVDEWFEIFMGSLEDIFSMRCQLTLNNLCNYWLLTTFKKYPAIFTRLSKTLLPPKYTLHCVISIWKQANKLGLLESTKEYIPLESGFMTMFDEQVLQKRMKSFSWVLHTALYNAESSTSMQAFDIVCMSRKNTEERLKIESHIVEAYVAYHCNSDATNLRISMINNVKLFLSRVHSYLSPLRPFQKLKENRWVMMFCQTFSKMLYTNLKDFCHDSNYQRTITCLKVLQLYLDWIHRPTSKKETSQDTVTLYQYLHMSRCATRGDHCATFDMCNQLDEILTFLTNPSEDIRDCASEILLAYFLKIMRADGYGLGLAEAVQLRIDSEIFHEIECAVSIAKVATMVLVDPENCKGPLRKKFSPVIAKLITGTEGDSTLKLLTEYKGQFHGFLSVIRAVIETAWELGIGVDDILGENFIDAFLENAKEIPSIYSSRSNHDKTSPDFSEMNEVVLNYINGLGKPVDLEEAQMSGLYQTVLCGIWLTIKELTELAACVALQTRAPEDAARAQACLTLITDVLETCRHKGVIEAAGNCLARCIRHLSQQPAWLARLPSALLDSKVRELVRETTTMPSVTRRGAGLSILVHRIVASDARPNKLMFHHLIVQLLQICTGDLDALENQQISDLEDQQRIDNQQENALESQKNIKSSQRNQNIKSSGTHPNMTSLGTDKSAGSKRKTADVKPKVDLSTQIDLSTEALAKIALDSQIVAPPAVQVKLTSETQVSMTLQTLSKKDPRFPNIISLETHRRMPTGTKDMKPTKTASTIVSEILMDKLSKIKQLTNSETQDSQKPEARNAKASEGVRDIPKAVLMHILARIVKDSSLGPNMLHYSPQLAELIFTNMTNDQWQIRNAALQLYGSLVPKLIGQNKTNELENSATVAFDELRTHSPKVWTYIREELSKKASSSSLIEHSDLVPIMSLLANMAYRYDFNYNKEAYAEIHEEMLMDLVDLLRSPLQTLRRLTATSLLKMYTTKEVCNAIFKAESCQTENFCHGCLLYLEQARQTKNQIGEPHLTMMKHIFGNPKSFVCKSLSCVVFDQWPDTVEEVFETQRRHKCAPGVSDWAKVCIKNFFKTNEDPFRVLELCIGEADTELYFKYFLHEVEQERKLLKHHKSLHRILTKAFGLRNHHFIWEFLYEVCRLGLKLEKHAGMIHEAMPPALQRLSYVHRMALPLAVRLLPHLPRPGDVRQHAAEVSRVVLSAAHFDNSNADVRMAAALACNEYAGLLRMRDHIKTRPGNVFWIQALRLECSFVEPDYLDDVLRSEATGNIICAFAFLLLDEEEEVRAQICKFFSIVMGFKWPPCASFLFYNCFSKPEFIHKLIPPEDWDLLSGIAKDFIQLITSSERKVNGPFHTRFKNPNVELAFYQFTFRKLRKANDKILKTKSERPNSG